MKRPPQIQLLDVSQPANNNNQPKHSEQTTGLLTTKPSSEIQFPLYCNCQPHRSDPFPILLLRIGYVQLQPLRRQKSVNSEKASKTNCYGLATLTVVASRKTSGIFSQKRTQLFTVENRSLSIFLPSLLLYTHITITKPLLQLRFFLIIHCNSSKDSFSFVLPLEQDSPGHQLSTAKVAKPVGRFKDHHHHSPNHLQSPSARTLHQLFPTSVINSSPFRPRRLGSGLTDSFLSLPYP